MSNTENRDKPNVYYFAYGSNMNKNRMIDRKAHFTERRLAKLINYEFVLNKHRLNGTAAANVREKEGSVVFGALYTCGHDALEFLDHHEGVKKKHYYRESVTVELETGEKISVITYIAHSTRVNDNLRTVDTDYLNHILGGSDILPNDYVKFLETFKEWCG